VRTYLYGIALKLLAVERRKDRDPIPQQPDTGATVEEALWVRQALEKLEPAEREILMLREYEQGRDPASSSNRTRGAETGRGASPRPAGPEEPVTSIWRVKSSLWDRPRWSFRAPRHFVYI